MYNSRTPTLFLIYDVGFLGRHVPQAAASMKEGKWDRKKVRMT